MNHTSSTTDTNMVPYKTKWNASHILNHRHKYGSIQDKMELIVPAHKRVCKNCLENLYIQFHEHAVLKIYKQSTGEFNPLYKIMHNVQLLHTCT